MAALKFLSLTTDLDEDDVGNAATGRANAKGKAKPRPGIKPSNRRLPGKNR